MPELSEEAPSKDQSSVRLEASKILVSSPESPTEACLCAPAVRAIRNARPDATLAILSPDSIASLWKTLTGIDELITYPDEASASLICRTLKASSFQAETSLAWEASNAATALAKARIDQRIGYDFKPLGKRLTHSFDIDLPIGPVEHRVRYYMGLVEKLGIQGYVASSFTPPALPPRPHPIRIGLVPGSLHGESYRWGVNRFRELGDAILTRHPVELVILAYPGNVRAANELDDRFQGRVRNFANEFDLADLLAALPHCSFLVSNDGAVTHLAAHLGIPTVALFGPGDPVAMRPLGKQHKILTQYVDCSPCNLPRCPLEHHRCLDELSVARVYQSVSALLEMQD